MFKFSRKQLVVVVSAVSIYFTASVGYMAYAHPKHAQDIAAVEAVVVQKKGTEKALEQSQKVVEDLSKEVAVKEQAVTDATKSVGELQVQNQSLQSEVEKLKQENARLSLQSQELLVRKQELVNENQSLVTKVQSLVYTKKNVNPVRALSANTNGPVTNGTPLAKAGDTVKVTATAYTAECTGCTGITYTGIDVRESTPKIIAVDPTVIPLKSTIELFVSGKSWGIYTAEDIGSAIKGNRIDILYSNETDANNFGVRYDVEVKVIKKPSVL